MAPGPGAWPTRAELVFRRARDRQLSWRFPALHRARAGCGPGRKRQVAWPGRATFLQRILPRHDAAGMAEDAVLIDGSVLANAPFAQAIGALKDRPARRLVDRRFVYIQPSPGHGRLPADLAARPR